MKERARTGSFHRGRSHLSLWEALLNPVVALRVLAVVVVVVVVRAGVWSALPPPLTAAVWLTLLLPVAAPIPGYLAARKVCPLLHFIPMWATTNLAVLVAAATPAASPAATPAPTGAAAAVAVPAGKRDGEATAPVMAAAAAPLPAAAGQWLRLGWYQAALIMCY
jgi:hypothetical protein